MAPLMTKIMSLRHAIFMKQFIAEGKVSERVRSKLNDFPKIAITHTVTENDDDSIKKKPCRTIMPCLAQIMAWRDYKD